MGILAKESPEARIRSCGRDGARETNRNKLETILVVKKDSIVKKKQTKADKFNDYADAVQAIRESLPPRRHTAKDGSIPTHPVVPVFELPEKEVVKGCLAWLKRHRIFCTRHDVGGGYLGAGTAYATYGIKGAGDIIGLLRNGRHFEIECKTGKGGRLSLNQQKRMHNIRDNNGIYLVVHGCEELAFYFKDLI